ncbi:MAG: hypothetical protein ACREIF_01965 [Chthoniobacterales bacterium]
MRCSASLASLFLATMAFASPLPSGFVKQDEEYRSESGDTIVRVYRKDDADMTMQFRVFRTGDADQNGLLLWQGSGATDASALVSYDGGNIAINRKENSDLGVLFVFTRRQDGSYKRIDVDFQKQAWKLFTEQLGLKNEPVFDHIFCNAQAWLTDSLFVGVLSGFELGPHPHSLDGFWFIFDCSTKKFFFDLREINKFGFDKTKKDDK